MGSGDPATARSASDMDARWRRVLSRWPAVDPEFAGRLGGVSVILGGGSVLLAAAFSFLLTAGFLSAVAPGYPMYAEEYRAERLLSAAYALPGPVGTLAIAAGLTGLCAPLAVRSGGWARPATVGALVAAGCAAGSIWFTIQESFPRYLPHDPSEVTPLQAAQVAVGLGWMGGVLLAGVTALRLRSLGGWRFLPVPFVFAMIPIRRLLVLLPYPFGPLWMPAPAVGAAALLEAPRALGGAGWVLFGLLMLRARERELVAASEENRAVMRRLYEEVWDGGRHEAVDELVAPGFVDHRSGREGPEELKRTVRGLRDTFPDLRFEVRDQTVDGAWVTTVWEARGTDRGGLLWYPPTGKSATFSGVFFDRVADGRVVEHAGRTDMAELYEQLGLPPGAVRRGVETKSTANGAKI